MMLLYACLGLMACQSPPSLSAQLQIVEQAKQKPQEALEICRSVSLPDLRNECFSMSAQHLSGSPAIKETLCKELSGTLRGECFFELAEELQKVELCALADPFVMDCRLHILEAQCGRFSSLTSLLSLVEDLDLDAKHPNVGNILYGCLLSHPQPHSICADTPNPTQCAQIRSRQQRR